MRRDHKKVFIYFFCFFFVFFQILFHRKLPIDGYVCARYLSIYISRESNVACMRCTNSKQLATYNLLYYSNNDDVVQSMLISYFFLSLRPTFKLEWRCFVNKYSRKSSNIDSLTQRISNILRFCFHFVSVRLITSTKWDECGFIIGKLEIFFDRINVAVGCCYFYFEFSQRSSANVCA